MGVGQFSEHEFLSLTFMLCIIFLVGNILCKNFFLTSKNRIWVQWMEQSTCSIFSSYEFFSAVLCLAGIFGGGN